MGTEGGLRSKQLVMLAVGSLLLTACASQSPGPATDLRCSPASDKPPSTVVGEAAATVAVTGVACAIVPAGLLAKSQRLELRQTSDAETGKELSDADLLYSLHDRVPYQIRVSLGSSPPTGPVTVGLQIASGGSAPRAAPLLLAQIVEASPLGLLDQFERLPATADGQIVRAQVPPYAFSQRSDAAGAFEAIIAVAWATSTTIAGSNAGPYRLVAAQDSNPTTTSLNGATYPCPSLRSPIQGWDEQQVVTHIGSGFGLRGAGAHYGIDVAVPVHTPVVSPLAGTVAAIDFNYRPDAAGTVTKGSGWGQYVVIRGADGTLVLLAHLEGGIGNRAPSGQLSPIALGLRVRQHVTVGQPLGYSDTTGGATGPHLHMEVVVSGTSYDRTANPFKVDPEPCLRAAVITPTPSLTATPTSPAPGVGAATPLDAVRALSSPLCGGPPRFSNSTGCPLTTRLEANLHAYLQGAGPAQSDPICRCQQFFDRTYTVQSESGDHAVVTVTYDSSRDISWAVVRLGERWFADDSYCDSDTSTSVYASFAPCGPRPTPTPTSLSTTQGNWFGTWTYSWTEAGFDPCEGHTYSGNGTISMTLTTPYHGSATIQGVVSVNKNTCQSTPTTADFDVSCSLNGDVFSCFFSIRTYCLNCEGLAAGDWNGRLNGGTWTGSIGNGPGQGSFSVQKR